VTSRPADNMPEWMQKQIEEQSRSVSKQDVQTARSERLLGTAENEPEELVH